MIDHDVTTSHTRMFKMTNDSTHSLECFEALKKSADKKTAYQLIQYSANFNELRNQRQNIQRPRNNSATHRWYDEIGRASCRERVQISVVAVSLKKKPRRKFFFHPAVSHVSFSFYSYLVFNDLSLLHHHYFIMSVLIYN